MDVDTFALTGGRLVGSVAAMVALAGAIAAGLALTGRFRGRVALVVAAAGAVAGVYVVATADGGPGTGNGIVGGYVAVALGLIGVVLGGIALTRARRPARSQ